MAGQRVLNFTLRPTKAVRGTLIYLRQFRCQCIHHLKAARRARTSGGISTDENTSKGFTVIEHCHVYETLAFPSPKNQTTGE